MRPFMDCVAQSVIPGGFASYARLDNENEGRLGEGTCRALVEVLVSHTSAPENIWLAVWNGFGGIYGDDGSIAHWFAFNASADAPPADYRPFRQAPRRHPTDALIRHEHREFLLYRGRLEVVPGWLDGPNLWWPDDRSWCVATEIDLPWTYVGGSKALIEDVLADERLGAKPVSLAESTLARDHPELGERP